MIITSGVSAGVDPLIMVTGPTPATRKTHLKARTNLVVLTAGFRFKDWF